MPEPPGPDDRLGLRLSIAWSRMDGGFRGALISSGTGRWEWECNHEPHASIEDAKECARAEVRARRGRLST